MEMSRKFICFLGVSLLLFFWANRKGFAQKDSLRVPSRQDTSVNHSISYYRGQRDLVDEVLLLLHKDINSRLDSSGGGNTRVHLSLSPIIEYTLATEFTGGIAASCSFLGSLDSLTNPSTFLGAVKYTQKQQFLLPIQSSLWTAGNKFVFLGDWRYLYYPQDTYGIGGFTTFADRYTVTYKYLRFYQFALKHIGEFFYMGMGYQLDYHWDISESGVAPGKITDFQTYGFSKASASSGIALDLLYDSRKNSLNPVAGGFYGNLEFLQNSRALGSTGTWNSVILDLRKYIGLPHQNLLAFWLYASLTLTGNPPYLDLPGIASDSYNNTGRGYEQGRYIGKRYIDLEAEFRFGISRNGLFGGVLFCDAGSVTEMTTNRFETILPGIGAGLRIKINKFSGTNDCFDYGFGIRGSRGFAGNLGEVF